MVSQIEHYRIIRELGSGGFANVYLAEDERLHREVAVKLMHASLAGNTDYRRFFEREARLVASLEHLAVVPIYDYGEINRQLFLVMRLMRGGTLSDRLEKEKTILPLSEVIALLERLAPTLDAMHERGVIHRDLKPSNILYDDSGTAYIADFGIARIQQSTTRYTQTGMSFGTLQYSSPEQVTGESNIDHRSDIYTLGVILFELLTAQYPFWSDTPLGWVHKHAEAPIPNVLDINGKLPAALQGVLEGMLAKAPDDRYSSVRAVLEDLKRVEAGQPIAFQPKPKAVVGATVPLVNPRRKSSQPIQQPETPKAATAPRPPFRLPLWLAGAAILLVVLTVGALAWNNMRVNGDRADAPTATPLPGATEDVIVVVPTESGAADDTPVPLTATTAPTPTPEPLPTEPVVNATWTSSVAPTATESATYPTETVPAGEINEATATAQVAYAVDLLPIPLRQRPQFYAHYAAEDPVIDGDFEEWQDAYLTLVEYALYQPENIADENDLSAGCAGRWTRDALYLVCVVLDDMLVQTASGDGIFRGDSVELLFDTELDADLLTQELNGDDHQIGVLPGNVFERENEVYRWYPAEKAGAITSIEVASLRVEDIGYGIEMRIPWTEINIKPRADAYYGFGMSINDNDTPNSAVQESQVTLSDRQRWGNPTTWGLLYLLRQP